jgi:8-oxo-dGTP diphosphatase
MKPVRVAAKAVIVRDGKLLVTKNVGIDGTFYLLPGGGQEPGEPLLAALRRECQEEIGADVDVHDLLYVRDYIGRNHEFRFADGEFHQLELMFRCSLLEGQEPCVGTTPDIRQVAVEWIDLTRLDRYALYPKILQTLLRSEIGDRAMYLGDVN